MKVEEKVRKQLTRATIKLENEREIKCLTHLLLCDVNPDKEDYDYRQPRLAQYGLSHADISAFQRKLRTLLMEDDC